MKRSLMVGALLWVMVGLWADDYAIVFNSSQKDSSSPVTAYETIILSATDNMVVGASKISKIYRAQEGFGIKGGTGSVKGELTLLLSQTYHPDSLTVYAAAYGSDTKPIVVCGQTITWQTGHATEIRPYRIKAPENGLDSIDITASQDKNNRFYIQQITFSCAEPTPEHAKLTTPLSFTFPSVPYAVGDTAQDENEVTIAARYAAQPLHLSLFRGTVFSLADTLLPAEGGDVTLRYAMTYKGTANDTLYISAKGTDNVPIVVRMPIEVTSYAYTPKPFDSTGMVIGPFSSAYYLPIEGKADSALKSGLAQIINCGVRYRYGSGSKHTWAGFYYTDRDTTTNQVLDMYSDNIRYFDTERPTASVAEFDIEHCLPKSWWGGIDNDAYKDLYHLLPGDYSANRSKSNHAPGIPADTTFWNGSFATGSNPDYPVDKVFCPEDQYKGDFARAWFYIACCYGDVLTWVEKADSEPAAAMTNEGYEEFRPWLRDVLLAWHRQDPVSEKELLRAIAVNTIQGNRNPFIDYPELVEYIWGNKKGNAVVLSDLVPSYPDTPVGIHVADATNAATRLVWMNGQIYVQTPDALYDLSGHVVK